MLDKQVPIRARKGGGRTNQRPGKSALNARAVPHIKGRTEMPNPWILKVVEGTGKVNLAPLQSAGESRVIHFPRLELTGVENSKAAGSFGVL
jgi:hypothetical protein